MELKLKHLAPYLPYQLNCNWQNKIYILQSVTIADRCKLLDNFNNELYGTKLEHIKPILKTLSDLSKEIEVNGEKFVPIEFFDDEDTKSWLIILSETKDIEWALSYLGFFIVQKLFEWRFDVFGLIENNLAIDINTLK